MQTKDKLMRYKFIVDFNGKKKGEVIEVRESQKTLAWSYLGVPIKLSLDNNQVIELEISAICFTTQRMLTGKKTSPFCEEMVFGDSKAFLVVKALNSKFYEIKSPAWYMALTDEEQKACKVIAASFSKSDALKMREVIQATDQLKLQGFKEYRTDRNKPVLRYSEMTDRFIPTVLAKEVVVSIKDLYASAYLEDSPHLVFKLEDDTLIAVCIYQLIRNSSVVQLLDINSTYPRIEFTKNKKLNDVEITFYAQEKSLSFGTLFQHSTVYLSYLKPIVDSINLLQHENVLIGDVVVDDTKITIGPIKDITFRTWKKIVNTGMGLHHKTLKD